MDFLTFQTYNEFGGAYEKKCSILRFKGTVLDTLLSTASDVVIYSNGTFTDMRIGKRRVTFSYVEECTVEK